jgi:hypothetical protein
MAWQTADVTAHTVTVGAWSLLPEPLRLGAITPLSGPGGKCWYLAEEHTTRASTLPLSVIFSPTPPDGKWCFINAHDTFGVYIDSQKFGGARRLRRFNEHLVDEELSDFGGFMEILHGEAA